jgi:hypothetical protein
MNTRERLRSSSLVTPAGPHNLRVHHPTEHAEQRDGGLVAGPSFIGRLAVE